ncbi:MAG: hypothetical protein ACI38Z_05115 [Parafannyhessea sp.]|uniref:hypothetical protein n=1 Tax=Parafannyhessea sp. TaxID=2847324 RepID=UPI003F0D2AC6
MPSSSFPAISYMASSGVRVVGLSGAGAYAGVPDGLCEWEWSYTLGGSTASGTARQARKATMAVAMMDPSVADELRHVAEEDVRAATPGTLRVGEWRQRALIVACVPSKVVRGAHLAKLTVLLLDGAWHRPHVEEFRAASSTSSSTGLDLPYDLPYDMAPPAARTTLATAGWGPSPVSITYWGPATNPAIAIAGNTYEVDVEVPSGARVELDGLAKTATLILVDGTRQSVFSKAVRGSGVGCGRYAFQPVPAGTHGVGWDQSFSFDLTWWEEEGSPAWT